MWPGCLRSSQSWAESSTDNQPLDVQIARAVTASRARRSSAVSGNVRPIADVPGSAGRSGGSGAERAAGDEPRNFNRSFSRCVAAAKVPVITVHGTRKTCGSLLAALDVHPRVAMQILRHSKIAVTMEIYTEVPSAATREALSKLSQWLDSDS
jgi:integrase